MEQICKCKLKNHPGALVAGSGADEFNFSDSYNNTALGFYLLTSGFVLICLLVFLTCKGLQYLEKRNNGNRELDFVDQNAQVGANHLTEMEQSGAIAPKAIKPTIPGPVWTTMADLSKADQTSTKSPTESTKTLPSYASSLAMGNQETQGQPPQTQLEKEPEIILSPSNLSKMLMSSGPNEPEQYTMPPPTQNFGIPKTTTSIPHRVIALNGIVPSKKPEFQINLGSIENTVPKSRMSSPYFSNLTSIPAVESSSSVHSARLPPRIASPGFENSIENPPNEKDLYVILKETHTVTQEPLKPINKKIWFPKSRFSYAAAIQNQNEVPALNSVPEVSSNFQNSQLRVMNNLEGPTPIIVPKTAQVHIGTEAVKVESQRRSEVLEPVRENERLLSSVSSNVNQNPIILKDTFKRHDFMTRKQTEFLRLQHQIRILEEKLKERSNTLSHVSQENIQISQKNFQLQQELLELQALLHEKANIESPIKVSKIHYDFTELNRRISALQNTINLSPSSHSGSPIPTAYEWNSGILIQKIHDLRTECQNRIMETRNHFENLLSQNATSVQGHLNWKLESQNRDFLTLQSKLSLMEARIVNLSKEKYELESKLRTMESNQNSVSEEKSKYEALILALEKEKQQILSEYQDLLEIKGGLDTEISMYRTLVENAGDEDEIDRSEQLSSSDGDGESSRSKTPQSPININEVKLVYKYHDNEPKKIVHLSSSKESDPDLPSLESAF